MSTRRLNADGQPDLFPPVSPWTPPTSLPMLRGIEIGIDTETKDGGLVRDRGAGWPYRDGWLCGVSVAWGDEAIYVPVRHPETECRPLGEVVAWVEWLLRECHCCFFNMGYDLGWLGTEGCRVWPERADDAGTMAFLVEENYLTYNLDDCARREGLEGKDETLLLEAATSLGIQPVHGSIKHGLWRMPGKYVGPYAEEDARQTLRLCQRLRPRLAEQGLEEAYQTEIRLRRVTNAMRRRGIRLNASGVEQGMQRVGEMLSETLAGIAVPWRSGCTLEDLRSPDRLKVLLDSEGVVYPLTPKTQKPSITRNYLEFLEHPIGKRIRRARKLGDLKEKFLGTYLMKFDHMGRIHAEIRELGAVTHRFSYANPPLQQMPSRDEELSPIVRTAFLPEHGQDWLAADYKGQEPRLNIHFAYLAKKDARKYGIDMGDIEGTVNYYRTDPNPDFHTLGAGLLGLTRKEAKDLNQGMTYRMGAAKLAVTLNMDEQEADDRWHLYHERIPYISGIARYAECKARERGYVRMIDGARRHFTLWQPRNNRLEGQVAFREDAEKKWPGVALERAFVYQAGNGVVQGSAARQTKRAMVAMYDAGHLPLIQMHDELGASVDGERQCREIGDIMIETTRLVVPVGVDLEVGPSWGKAKTSYERYYSGRGL